MVRRLSSVLVAGARGQARARPRLPARQSSPIDHSIIPIDRSDQPEPQWTQFLSLLCSNHSPKPPLRPASAQGARARQKGRHGRWHVRGGRRLCHPGNTTNTTPRLLTWLVSAPRRLAATVAAVAARTKSARMVFMAGCWKVCACREVLFCWTRAYRAEERDESNRSGLRDRSMASKAG